MSRRRGKNDGRANAVYDFSGFFIACGVVALLIGSVGLLRLPDVYCRIHAVGMIDTAGAGFIILGMIIHEGFTLVTVLVLIGIFLFFQSYCDPCGGTGCL